MELPLTRAHQERISEDKLVINVGPQHPSTHGVLRMIVTLDGERIDDLEPVIGYLHRGMEKIAESRTYYQYLPMTDRIDYLSSFHCLSAFATAVEAIAGLKVPRRADYIRLITMELNRIASHLMWLGAMLLDLGASSVIFYTFRERESITGLLEELTGARLLYNYFCFGGVKRDLPEGWIERTRALVKKLDKAIDEYEAIVTENPIFMARCKGIGVISAKEAVAWGLTGPNLRASGVPTDLRKTRPYSVYSELDWQPVVGSAGDSYERYVVRMEEMRVSSSIILQALDRIPGGPSEKLAEDRKKCGCGKETCEVCGFDTQIYAKKPNLAAFKPPAGEENGLIESPRGILGCYVVSDGTPKPWRVRWRTGSFAAVQVLPPLMKGLMYADLMAVFGSLDVVLPEVDR